MHMHLTFSAAAGAVAVCGIAAAVLAPVAVKEHMALAAAGLAYVDCGAAVVFVDRLA